MHSYQVVNKPNNVLEDISKFIEDHRNQSGIIYCCRKEDCEKVASKLRNDFNIQTKHYHAGMGANERSEVQKKWQKR